MIAFDPLKDRFVPPSLAPSRAQLTPREFRPYTRPGSRLPVFHFPPVAPRGSPVERYLVADLQALADGALL
jgi:hypothetical protein